MLVVLLVAASDDARPSSSATSPAPSQLVDVGADHARPPRPSRFKRAARGRTAIFTPAVRAATPSPRAMLKLVPPARSKVERVIAFARAQVGKPYVWAADGPGSYDCSGLVMTSFAQVGVRLPHQSGAMLGYGRRIARSELRRGDVVWPQYGHVAIYLGNNTIVHAANRREDVTVSRLYGFYAARRMLE